VFKNLVINIAYVIVVAGNIPSQMKESSSIANAVATLFLYTPPPPPKTNSVSSWSEMVLMSHWAVQVPHRFTFIQWQQFRPSLNGPAVKAAINIATGNRLCAWCTFNVHLFRLVTNFLLSFTFSASFYKDLPIWIRKIRLLTKWKWFLKSCLDFRHFCEVSEETQECLDQAYQYSYWDSKQDFQT
jgi:hypothetical protein